MKIFSRIVLIITLIAIGSVIYKFLPEGYNAPDEILIGDDPSSEQEVPESLKEPEKNIVISDDASQNILSKEDILSRSQDGVDTTSLPLGDNKVTFDAPEKGFYYSCAAEQELSENTSRAPEKTWLLGDTWNRDEKPKVAGDVTWPQERLEVILEDDFRILTGNNLPQHATGVFPLEVADPASAVTENEYSIEAFDYALALPATPIYNDKPTCIKNTTIGFMLSGALLQGALDINYQDQQAREVFDACGGHPDENNRYHYHGQSCEENKSHTEVLGWALDGFPITGNRTEKGVLTTADLDLCHGMISEIMIDDVPTVTYHYVLTEDYPYSINCFRGKPVEITFEEVSEDDNEESLEG